MAEYDLVIRGGTIVDGTGVPRYRADLAVKNGRIAKISGKIPSGSAKEIDGSGCIVAPGAVDLHTHYDAQVQWDPYCSLSGWFGVTSLTIAQCGFGFAPTKPEDRDLNMRMMNRIEAIPLRSMQLGMRWDWETFPQFLDSLDGQGLGVNIGALFPFSPMRGYVLGMMPARERTLVTGTELNRMKELFHEAMVVGAFGFSLNLNMEDRAEDGGALPSHVASEEELLGLAEVLGEFGVGHMSQTIGFGLTPEEQASMRETLTRLMRLSGRPLHMVDVDEESGPGWMKAQRAEGLPVMLQRQCNVIEAEFKLSEFNLYDYMPNWVQPLVGTGQERAAKLRDPAVRAGMKQDVEETPYNMRADYNVVKALEVVHERNYPYEGLTMTQLGDALGKHPLDAWLDLAIDEEMETVFSTVFSEGGEELARALKDPYSHISFSDGGAHTRYLTSAIWPVLWLSYWLRDKEIMSLEEGIYKMSALPAWLADFKGRGTLRVGDWADIIVYNQDEIGFLYDKPVFANDFPGGERRVIQKAKGLRYTIVNGAVTFEGTECTGAVPGKLLRSYDMVS